MKSNLLKKFLFFSPLLLIQYPLWFGQGGWLEVWSREEKLKIIEQKLVKRSEELLQIKAEINDYKNGYNSIEEKARYEMGMIKDGEKFLQIIEINEKENF